MTNTLYRGRFAPSPTGPLHFGSLIAAISSYAQAHKQNGKWLVRIEDVDQPRCDATSSKLILEALETYGMYWDEDIIYQSHRDRLYQTALATLKSKNLSYDCACSRKDINKNTEPNHNSIYPGTCKDGIKNKRPPRSVRMRTTNEIINFNDKVQGYNSQNIAKDIGDFVIKRADNLFAYQLAVVVDDEEQNITEVVRGSDMLDSTPRQILLQQSLGYSTPSYMHIPLATAMDGNKLSKQNMAPPINVEDPRPTLINALTFLKQCPPADLRDSNIETIWDWVINNWSIKAIPAKLSIPYNETND